MLIKDYIKFVFGELPPEKVRVIEEITKQQIFKANMPRRFLVIGRRLYKIKTEKKYKNLGYRTFELWINSRHNRYGSRRTVYNYIRLYLLWERKLKKHYTVSDIHCIDYSKLLKYASIIEKTDNDIVIDYCVFCAVSLMAASNKRG